MRLTTVEEEKEEEEEEEGEVGLGGGTESISSIHVNHCCSIFHAKQWNRFVTLQAKFYSANEDNVREKMKKKRKNKKGEKQK